MKLLHPLFIVTLVLTLHGYHGDSEEVKDVEALEGIMQDLDFIEKVENARASSDGDPATLQTRLDTCKGIAGRSHTIDGDYAGLVATLLPLWNDCEQVWNHYLALAEWNFETNITEETEAKLNAADTEVSGVSHNLSLLARAFTEHQNFSNLDETVQRQLDLLAMDDTPKSKTVQENLSKVLTEMQNIYSKATVNNKAMEPDITKIMASSRNAAELEEYWKGWRDATGAKMRQKYADFVKYANQGAVENGYTDYGQSWLEHQFGKVTDIKVVSEQLWQEAKPLYQRLQLLLGIMELSENNMDLDQTVCYTDYGQSWLEHQFGKVTDIKVVSEQLWQEVKPLYQRLHAYVRKKLRATYPKYESLFATGAIPAHLMGNMWAQQWNNIYSLVKPFPEIPEPNYDKALRDQGYDVDDLFELAEGFYTSIGLFPMTDKFKAYSMTERPADREVVCHASASDFYSEDDFRIKMCTEVNTEYLSTIHHEMGHIEYFMAYKDQPTVFRDGANSGFHEAIGDTISLSVMSTKHMKTINLTETEDSATTKSSGGYTDDEKREINYLLNVALSKIAFLPFGYLIDKWRWNVFDGTTTESDYNKDWWKLRLEYQGIVPPVQRSEADFDPGAKFHIPSNSPYICYFISFILQFQFYEAMCTAGGEYNKDTSQYLHTCDFYQNTAAGTLLKNMMSLGKSKPWDETLHEITGSNEISSQSILSYFKPLDDWLKEVTTPSEIGWNSPSLTLDQSASSSKHPIKFDGPAHYFMKPSKGRYRNFENLKQSKNRSQKYKQNNERKAIIALLHEILGDRK